MKTPSLTWIVKYLDGTEKKYTKTTDLLRDTEGKKFFEVRYSYCPNTITLIESN